MSKETILKRYLILFLLLWYGNSIAQQTTTNYLVFYGQVWGFLKYFHPVPGECNWDKVLLTDFRRVQQCNSDEEFNGVIAGLIGQCGTYEGVQRTIPDSMYFKESVAWMQDSLLDTVNSGYLQTLKANKPSFKNNYIEFGGAGNPKLINEPQYSQFSADPAMLYLALTRYWNIINYFYPYRNIIPDNWTDVYRKYIPVFSTVGTYEEYYFAVRRLTTELRDGHGFVRTENDPLNRYKYTPFYPLRVKEGVFITWIWDDTLRPSKLQMMDQLIAINGVPLEKKMEEIGEIFSTSNDYYLSNSTYYLHITDQDSMTVTVKRGGVYITDTLATIDREALMERYKPPKAAERKEPYRFVTDSISNKRYGYIHMGRLKRSDINGNLKRSLRKTDHLIIDSRNYPNETVIELCKLLIKGETTFAKFIQMDIDYPGSYVWTWSQVVGHKRKGYEGKIYVLVDYTTMSQAEYTVMAFQQHPNTIVIGGQTAGADGNISEIPLPFGIQTVFSGLGVFYPDGRPTQQVGVYRDVEVIQEKSYLEEHRDLQMEKALELIRQ